MNLWFWAEWGVPLLVFAGAVVYFVVFMRRLHVSKDSPHNQALAEMKRHNEALEKILASIDARLQKIEDTRSQIAN